MSGSADAFLGDRTGAAMGVFLAVVYGAAGWLVLRRVREHWSRPHRVLAVVAVLLWPVVVLGIEVGWLLVLNDWTFRPR